RDVPRETENLSKLTTPGNFSESVREVGRRKRGFLGGSVVKNLPANAGDRKCRFNPWVGKILWRRK
ncbi:hypothetical protein ABEP38_12500, partial [Cutibacterium acnes]